MRNRCAASFLLIVSTVSICYGWHLEDEDPPVGPMNFTRGFLVCPCSPSESGASLKAISLIEGGLHSLAQAIENATAHGRNVSESIDLFRPTAMQKLEACFKKSNYQACINVDGMMRNKYNSSFCTYDNNSKKNLARLTNGTWVTTSSKCPKRVFDVSPYKPQNIKPGIEWCYCSPNGGRNEKNVNRVLQTMLQGIDPEKITQEQANKDLIACAKKFSYGRCVNADASLRGKYTTSLCRWDEATGRNVGPDFMGNSSGYITVGQCRETDGIDILGPFVQDQASAAFLTTRSGKPAAVNEGCVAVKHLRGYKLQHARHLIRPVLCHNGFCATPNHGVYYNGMYTSLKILCEGPEIVCGESQMEVNNLKISGGYLRVRVNNEFDVSPYDYRVPWPIIWIVQMLEDVLEATWISFQVGFAVTVILFAHERLSNLGIGNHSR